MKNKQQWLILPILLIPGLLLVSCGRRSSEASADTPTAVTEESADTPATVTEESAGTPTAVTEESSGTSATVTEEIPLNDNIPSSSTADYTLYTEDSSSSIPLILPEGFTLSEFSDETRMRFVKEEDNYNLDILLVLWKKDVGEIEKTMIAEAHSTAVPDPSFSGNNVEEVHNITVGDLSAQGFQYSYTASKYSCQGYRIWIPFKDETSLICIAECTKKGENLPNYTEEMAIELIQMILPE